MHLTMRCRRPVAVTLLAAALSVSSPAIAQHHELGKVTFPTSCSPAVQADFETGDAMRQLSERFSEDFEAQVYYALTLQASAPKSDMTYANQYKSAAMLERLYTQQPQHPGITHYLIHAYDFAPFADKGIPAARRYASIAPAVPHARHMPAHIYSMVGMWQDSITSNLSALEIQPDYYHAADFTVYAHLQLAQDVTAAKMIEQALATAERGDRPPSLANYTAKIAMPARYVLERAD